MFTRPIKPFITAREFAADGLTIRGYANALDYHSSRTIRGLPESAGQFRIIRCN